MLHRNSVQPGTPAHAAGHVTDHGSCRPDTVFLPALGGQGYRGRPPCQCCTRMCSTDFCIRQGWALISPVRGCGKTTLLILLEVLVAEGNRTDNITAAAIYYHLDRRPRTTLRLRPRTWWKLRGARERIITRSIDRAGGG